VRIPRSIAEGAGLVDGTSVEVMLEGGQIIVRPAAHTLESLVAGVTPENIHGETATGRPVGREVW
jgi:antitoxin MazE